MSVKGYLGDQIGSCREHADMLEISVYGGWKPVGITVECAKCGVVVAELFNADTEAAAKAAPKKKARA